MAHGRRHTAHADVHNARAHANAVQHAFTQRVSLRFVKGLSVRVGLRSASSASANDCGAARVFVHRTKSCVTFCVTKTRSSCCSCTKPTPEVDEPKPSERRSYFYHGTFSIIGRTAAALNKQRRGQFLGRCGAVHEKRLSRLEMGLVATRWV